MDFWGNIAEYVLQWIPKPALIILLPSEKTILDWDKIYSAARDAKGDSNAD